MKSVYSLQSLVVTVIMFLIVVVQIRFLLISCYFVCVFHNARNMLCKRLVHNNLKCLAGIEKKYTTFEGLNVISCVYKVKLFLVCFCSLSLIFAFYIHYRTYPNIHSV